jgi:hypothetical protein
MAAPFGPSPKLRAYLDWARTVGGCDIKEGVNGTKSLIRIEGPDGRAVHLVGMKDTEVLSHSAVANLDRRLGVDAPFPKTPQPYR